MQPSSRAVTRDAAGNANCETDRALVVNENTETEVTYTYSVEWRVISHYLGVLMSSIPTRNGRPDGINIYTYSILEFTGSVSSILLLLSFS